MKFLTLDWIYHANRIMAVWYVNAHVENRPYNNVRGTYRYYQVKMVALTYLWEEGEIPEIPYQDKYITRLSF